MTMTRRLSRVAAVIAVAAVALIGAGVNLWLLEPHGAEPAAVLVAGPPTSTTSTTSTSTSTSTTSTTSTSTSTSTSTVDPSRTYAVGDAGTVQVALRDGQVVLGDIVATAGWTYEVDEEPGKAKVRFRRGDEELQLEAEIEGNRLQVEIESGDEPDD